MNERVIVSAAELQSYLDRGYARSEVGVEVCLGNIVWNALSHEEREGLVVVEIGKEAHAKLNSPPRWHALRYTHDTMITGVRLTELDELESTGADVLCADARVDGGPEVWAAEALHETSVAAVKAAEPSIRSAIRMHQLAIGELERFLSRHR